MNNLESGTASSEARHKKLSAFAFDPWLQTNSEAFRGLVERLTRDLQAINPKARWRRERTAHLRLIIANLVAAERRQPGKAIKYYRTPKAYLPPSRYRPRGISAKLLADLVDGLAEAEYADAQTGRWDYEGIGSYLSTVRAAPALASLIEEYGVSGNDLHRSAGWPAVVLRGPKRRDGRKPQIEVPPSRAASAIVYYREQAVKSINGFLRSHRFDLAPEHRLPRDPDPFSPLLDGEAEGGGLIDLWDTDLYRVFNNVVGLSPALDEGGRFYGGWWQRVRSESRQFITIDGEPTVELDYSGFHPRLIYHRERIPFAGDPYEVPAISALEGDWPPPERRKATKILLNVLINATASQLSGALKRPSDELAKEWGIIVPRGLEIGRLVAAIDDHHRPISHRFGVGYGLRLQGMDSDLCQKILEAGRGEDMPILPVHDSFIVRARDRERLLGIMISEYQRFAYGSRPVIESASHAVPHRDPVRAGESLVFLWH